MANHTEKVKQYYHSKESRVGYRLLLSGTKHFGYYQPGSIGLHFSKALRAMELRLGDSLALNKSAEVLDAGCGMGAVSRTIAKKYEYAVTGIDILDFNLTEARKKAQQAPTLQLQYKKMDYHALDFADQTFDGAYTMETFVHAHDPEKVLQELHRVLKPGGRLAQIEYSHDPYQTMSEKDKRAFLNVNRHAAMPTFDMLEHGVHEKMLEKAGFRVISSDNYMKNITPMLFWFMVLAWLPVKLARIFGKEEKIINAVSAVDFWRLRHTIRINHIVAEKAAE